MKIICAPDKFKGSLTALQACDAMKAGLHRVNPRIDVVLRPLSDGGEGFLDAMMLPCGAIQESATVVGPESRAVTAYWGWSKPKELALVESAQAVGLPHVRGLTHSPLDRTTYGLGEVLRAALSRSPRTLVVGLGGSSTCDGGAGMLQAMGAVFEDASGRAIKDPLLGRDLERIARIKLDPITELCGSCEIKVACDVLNPLTGAEGAARTFAPQKGASAEQVESLEHGMLRLADAMSRAIGKPIHSLPRTGAAGGLGAALGLLPRVELVSGIDLVIEAIQLAADMQGAFACLTGEGRLDGTTASGKVCHGVARIARKFGVKAFALVGQLAADSTLVSNLGLTGAREIGRSEPLVERIRNAAGLLTNETAAWLSDFLRDE